jgi:hypothetical protein
MFRIDNYDGPNATLSGSIKDTITGELVETDILSGSRLQLQEIGYPTGLLTRVVMQNGEYRDNLMFAGKYSVDFNACNFFPFFVPEIEVKKGDNVRDFLVTPYIRVKNVNITYSEQDSVVVATFTLQAGRPNVRVANVRLFAGSDIYVGDQFTAFTPSPRGLGFEQNFAANSAGEIINEATIYRLTLDLRRTTGNRPFFRYKQDYFFRVGALARVSGVGTIRRNYASHTIINFSAPPY